MSDPAPVAAETAPVAAAAVEPVAAAAVEPVAAAAVEPVAAAAVEPVAAAAVEPVATVEPAPKKIDPIGDDGITSEGALSRFYPSTIHSNVRIAQGGSEEYLQGHLRVDGAAEIAGALEVRGEAFLGSRTHSTTVLGDLIVEGNLSCKGDAKGVSQGDQACEVILSNGVPASVGTLPSRGAFIALVSSREDAEGPAATFLASSSGHQAGTIARLTSSPGVDGGLLSMAWPAGGPPQITLSGYAEGAYTVVVVATTTPGA